MSLPTFDRKWKMEFFFVFGFWARNPIDVGKDPFHPYTGEIENLLLEGMSLFTTYFISFVIFV